MTIKNRSDWVAIAQLTFSFILEKAEVHIYPYLNSSCPRAQNVKCLCYSQSKNRLHRKPLYFVTSIVRTGNRERKFE